MSPECSCYGQDKNCECCGGSGWILMGSCMCLDIPIVIDEGMPDDMAFCLVDENKNCLCTVTMPSEEKITFESITKSMMYLRNSAWSLKDMNYVGKFLSRSGISVADILERQVGKVRQGGFMNDNIPDMAYVVPIKDKEVRRCWDGTECVFDLDGQVIECCQCTYSKDSWEEKTFFEKLDVIEDIVEDANTKED